jgi:hypothetical protein
MRSLVRWCIGITTAAALVAGLAHDRSHLGRSLGIGGDVVVTNATSPHHARPVASCGWTITYTRPVTRTNVPLLASAADTRIATAAADRACSREPPGRRDARATHAYDATGPPDADLT